LRSARDAEHRKDSGRRWTSSITTRFLGHARLSWARPDGPDSRILKVESSWGVLVDKLACKRGLTALQRADERHNPASLNEERICFISSARLIMGVSYHEKESVNLEFHGASTWWEFTPEKIKSVQLSPSLSDMSNNRSLSAMAGAGVGIRRIGGRFRRPCRSLPRGLPNSSGWYTAIKL